MVSIRWTWWVWPRVVLNALTSTKQSQRTKHQDRVLRNGIFVFGHKNPIVLAKNSAQLFLLTRIRDEAHRFAVTYQRKVLRKGRVRTLLDDVPGIGPKRRKALLREFGSLTGIREASQEALEKVLGSKLTTVLQKALEQDLKDGQVLCDSSSSTTSTD